MCSCGDSHRCSRWRCCSRRARRSPPRRRSPTGHRRSRRRLAPDPVPGTDPRAAGLGDRPPATPASGLRRAGPPRRRRRPGAEAAHAVHTRAGSRRSSRRASRRSAADFVLPHVAVPVLVNGRARCDALRGLDAMLAGVALLLAAATAGLGRAARRGLQPKGAGGMRRLALGARARARGRRCAVGGRAPGPSSATRSRPARPATTAGTRSAVTVHISSVDGTRDELRLSAREDVQLEQRRPQLLCDRRCGRRPSSRSSSRSTPTRRPCRRPPSTVPADSNGWYNHPVSITFVGSDATSGIASCTTRAVQRPRLGDGDRRRHVPRQGRQHEQRRGVRGEVRLDGAGRDGEPCARTRCERVVLALGAVHVRGNRHMSGDRLVQPSPSRTRGRTARRHLPPGRASTRRGTPASRRRRSTSTRRARR